MYVWVSMQSFKKFKFLVIFKLSQIFRVLHRRLRPVVDLAPRVTALNSRGWSPTVISWSLALLSWDWTCSLIDRTLEYTASGHEQKCSRASFHWPDASGQRRSDTPIRPVTFHLLCARPRSRRHRTSVWPDSDPARPIALDHHPAKDDRTRRCLKPCVRSLSAPLGQLHAKV